MRSILLCISLIAVSTLLILLSTAASLSLCAASSTSIFVSRLSPRSNRSIIRLIIHPITPRATTRAVLRRLGRESIIVYENVRAVRTSFQLPSVIVAACPRFVLLGTSTDSPIKANTLEEFLTTAIPFS